MTHNECSRGLIRVGLLFAIALALPIPASAEWKEKVLYSFRDLPMVLSQGAEWFSTRPATSMV